MLLYTIELDEETSELCIGDEVDYFDKKIKVVQINHVDFINKKLVVRGLMKGKITK